MIDYEKILIENMTSKISELSESLIMASCEYEALKEEVLDFFKNVKSGRDPEACIKELEIGLSSYCDIEIAEEMEVNK